LWTPAFAALVRLARENYRSLSAEIRRALAAHVGLERDTEKEDARELSRS
jgi:hypothetical protein